jgi:hypothetical protein
MVRLVYARHGIPEAWLVDLRNRAVQIFRNPQEQIYSDSTTIESGILTVLMLPKITVDIETLLP